MQLDDLFPAGRVFGGDYRVQHLLKEGGFGSVFVAQQLSTERECALKVLRPGGEDARFRRHWETEAKASGRIKSDHVVRVLAAGIERTGVKETPWIAMELLEGQDFADLLAARGRLQWSEVDHVVKEVCHALGLAHEIGIVHRDLKPENLFLARSRTAGGGSIVKILDFGIAKMVKDRRTGTARMGTLGWLAPEQTRLDGKINPATDVWALGLIVFTLYTGKSYWLSCQNPNEQDPNLFFPELITEPLVPASARAAELDCAEHLPRWFDGWFARCVTRGARLEDASEAYAAFVEASASTPRTTRRPPPPLPVPATRPAPTAEPGVQPVGAVTHSSIKAFETNAEAALVDATARTRRARRAVAAGVVGLAALAWVLTPSAPGRLTITSNLPAGAVTRIFVDDRLACSSLPCTVPELAGGRHVVFAEADGYTTSPQAVEIEPGQQAIAHLPLAVTLTLDSDPKGAQVFLDGNALGTAPRTLSGLVPNKPHQLRLELDRYETWERTFTFKAGEQVPLTAQLVPLRPPEPAPPPPKEQPEALEPLNREPHRPEPFRLLPTRLPLRPDDAELQGAITAAHRACQAQLTPQDSGTLAQFQLAVSPAGVATVTPSALLSSKQPYAGCFLRQLRDTRFKETLMGRETHTRKLAL